MTKALVWKNHTAKNDAGECEGTGTRNGHRYEIMAGTEAGKFTATYIDEQGAPSVHELLAENVTGRTAWQKCVKHHKAQPARVEVVVEVAPQPEVEAPAEAPAIEAPKPRGRRTVAK